MRGRRWLGRWFCGLALGLVYASLALAAVLSLSLVAINSAPGRARLMAVVNAALERQFNGRLEVTRIERVDFSGAHGLGAELFDPDGRSTAKIEGADVRLNALRLLYGVLLPGAPLWVEIHDVVINDASVVLVENEAGVLTLAHALQTKARANQPRSADERPSKASVRVSFEKVEILHATLSGLGHSRLEATTASLSSCKGNLNVSSEGVVVNLDAARVEVNDLVGVASASGTLAGSLRVSLHEGPAKPSVAVRAEFAGQVDRLPLIAALDYDEPRFTARLHIQQAPPEAFRRLGPSLILAAPVDVHATAAGTLARSLVDVDVTSRGARLHANGTLAVAPEFATELELSAHALDLEALLPEAPSTALELRSKLKLARESNTWRGTIEASSAATTIQGHAVPAIDSSAELEGSSLVGRAHVRLPGAPTDIDYAVRGLGRVGGPEAIRFGLQTKLGAASWTGAPGLSATGRLEASGSIQPFTPAPTIEAQVSAELRELGLGAFRTHRLTARGSLWGPLQSPEVRLALEARGLALGARRVSNLKAELAGAIDALKLQLRTSSSVQVPEVELSGSLDLVARTLSDFRLGLRREQVSVQVQGRSLSISAGSIGVQGLALRGAGELELDAAVAGQHRELRASARSLDLGALGTLFAVPRADLQGVITLDTQLSSNGHRLSGALRASLERLGVDGLSGGRVSADLVAREGLVTGRVDATLGELGSITLRPAGLELPSAWSLSSWRGGTGTLDMWSSIDLQQIGRLGLAEAWAPAQGRLETSARLTRRPGQVATLKAMIATQGLGWQPAPEDGRSAAPRSMWPGVWHGVDVQLSAALDSAADSRLVGAFYAGRQQLSTWSLSSSLTRSSLDSLSLASLKDLPFELAVDLPRRKLQSLPAPLRPRAVDGDVQAEISVRGPLVAPTLAARVELLDLEFDGNAATRLNVHGRASYVNGEAELTATAERASANVIDLHARLALDASRLWSGEPWLDEPALDASLEANIVSFPLRALAALPWRDPSIDGVLDGHLTLESVAGRQSGSVSLRASPLTLAALPAQRLSLEAALEGGRLNGVLSLEQPQGQLRASVEAGLLWERLGVPHIDRQQGVQAQIEARDFRVALLRSWVPPAYRELDGFLGCQVDLNTTRRTLLTGTASIRNGVLQVPALGQELRDIHARVSLDRSGLLRLSEGSARAVAGRLTLGAEASFDGLEFQTGEAWINVGKRERIPITVQGVPIGTAWGRLELQAQRTEAELRARLEVPRLHVDLPSVAPNTVQPLESDASIATGTYLDQRRFVEWEFQPGAHEAPRNEAHVPIEALVVLGDDVWIHRGSTLEARLFGQLHAAIGERLSLAGSLAIPDGHVDVQGRLFELLDSTVTFLPDEDPTNPIVVASARWPAPDDYEVYAEFVGPFETGKLSLRSEPPLDENGIFSLLLFGSPEGQFGTSTASESNPGAATALGAGGGMLAQGLNRELQRLTSLDIRTRVDQSNGNPHPEVAIQISPRVTAELAYDLATPSPGESPDTTFLTLDLRLLRNWSLSTTFGNQGSTFVDMFWRYRY